MTAACGRPTSQAVGPVSLDVPGDWVVDDRLEASGDLIEERRWHPRADRSRTIQVLVGCGEGDADALRRALAEAYQVHDELRATDVEVAGLDSAQRVTLALTDDPLGDATGGFRLDGLYGAGSGGLVVVEVGSAEDLHDQGLVEQVMDSVEVDEVDLASRCAAAD